MMRQIQGKEPDSIALSSRRPNPNLQAHTKTDRYRLRESTQPPTSAKAVFRVMISLHRKIGFDALKRLLRSPVGSFFNALLIAVTLTLPVLLLTLIDDLKNVSANWGGRPSISVYFQVDAPQDIVEVYLARYSANPLISSTEMVLSDQGLKNFQSKIGLTDIVSYLGFNPLPHVLQLTIASDASLDGLAALTEELQKLNGVDSVQLDQQWVKRLHAILNAFKSFAMMLGGIFSVMVVLVISTNVRLHIESRRDEIRTTSMVGGTYGFIAMPFVYLGLWYGVIGALLASILVSVLITLLNVEVGKLALLYGSVAQISMPSWDILALLFVVGMFLGGSGALVSCYRHFKDLIPR